VVVDVVHRDALRLPLALRLGRIARIRDRGASASSAGTTSSRLRLRAVTSVGHATTSSATCGLALARASTADVAESERKRPRLAHTNDAVAVLRRRGLVGLRGLHRLRAVGLPVTVAVILAPLAVSLGDPSVGHNLVVRDAVDHELDAGDASEADLRMLTGVAGHGFAAAVDAVDLRLALVARLGFAISVLLELVDDRQHPAVEAVCRGLALVAHLHFAEETVLHALEAGEIPAVAGCGLGRVGIGSAAPRAGGQHDEQ